MRYILQVTFVGGAHFRERKGVLVILFLDGRGDSCCSFVLYLVSPLYYCVRTTETILDQRFVACESVHLVHPIFFLLEEYDYVGAILVCRQLIVPFDHRLVIECAAAV